jgi:hypothetical protein
MVNFKCRFLPYCAQIWNLWLISWREGPKGWSGQNVGVDSFHPGGFPKCKTLPGVGGVTPTPCPKYWTFPCHWCLPHPYRRGHATKIWRPLAASWFFLPQANRHRVPLSTFDHELLAAQAAIKHFYHFSRRSRFPTSDRPPTLLLPSHMFQSPFHPDNNAILAFI